MTEPKRRGRPPKNRPVEAPESPQEPPTDAPATIPATRVLLPHGRISTVRRRSGVWEYKADDSENYYPYVAQENVTRDWLSGAIKKVKQ